MSLTSRYINILILNVNERVFKNVILMRFIFNVANFLYAGPFLGKQMKFDLNLI
jgi:hypothetical protein